MIKRALMAGVLGLCASTASAQLSNQIVATGLSGPVFVTHAGDGSGRLFILEQAGRIRIVDAGGTLLTRSFLDITGPVRSGGERGLLGLAFHPDYAIEGADGEGKFYVNYTGDAGAGDTFISEFQVDPTDPDLAIAGTERILMQINQPFSNHNGGWIGFGPDGYLYISTGDGGSGGDPGNRSANLADLLGKMLRIDVDTQDAGLEYGIPADNAWANDASSVTTRDEIYHYGLRNAWRCSFDRDNGDMWIADVGQNAREEVNHNRGNVGGLFYGWRCREGLLPFTSCGVTGWTDPQYDYSHSDGCSITGGYVYRGCEMGEDFQGLYFFADYCTGAIWTLDPNNGYTRSTQFSAGFGVSSFGEDEDGEIYYTVGSTVRKIVNPSAPDDDNNGISDACESACAADLTGDGQLDFFDLSQFLTDFGNQASSADLTMDGSWDFFDLSAYLALYGQGCP